MSCSDSLVDPLPHGLGKLKEFRRLLTIRAREQITFLLAARYITNICYLIPDFCWSALNRSYSFNSIFLLKEWGISISTLDLAKARESASTTLEQLQRDAFIYEVEPRDDVWELTIECACEVYGGWETTTLQVPKRMLLDSFEDDHAKQQLFEYWQKKLADCTLREV